GTPIRGSMTPFHAVFGSRWQYPASLIWQADQGPTPPGGLWHSPHSPPRDLGTCSPHGHLYYSSRGFHSMVLQAIMDHQGMFMHMNAGWVGSTHDTCIFKNSSLAPRLHPWGWSQPPSGWAYSARLCLHVCYCAVTKNN
uniref:DDE Tnp4 domain-containing protein n=1 Tax=Crocodylus porosus TaxID=8502 RepID=A0A7M4ED63_CROPO